ncbi:MAG: O-antigen ligase family protein, partial [Clostridia bacterium]|nr:O-antigen ligase family protein [Clostridia bacterium]
IFYLLSLPFDLAGLWLCQCRTAFLVTAVVVVSFLCITNVKWIIPVAAVAIVGGAAVLLFPALLPRMGSLSDNMAFRFGIWKAALRCFADNFLIGRGYYAYSGIWVAYSDTTYFALHAHSLYIETLLNFGVVGFFSLFGYIFHHVRKTILNLKGKSDRAALALVISMLLAVLLHGTLDTTLFWPQTGIFAFMILASGKALRTENNGKEVKI